MNEKPIKLYEKLYAENKILKGEKDRNALWLSKQKKRFGYSDNISFDIVLDDLYKIKTRFEEKTDWSKVKVDTLVKVKLLDRNKFVYRHFSKYEKGKVYCWNDGANSMTSEFKRDTYWPICEIAEKNESGN